VGLALVVSREWQMPFFHQVSPGPLNDVREFSTITAHLVERFRPLGANVEDLPLVFDKGNNSEENFLLLAADQGHFVGSLVPAYHPALLQIPLEQDQPLSDVALGGVRAFRTQKEVFGDQYTVVLTFSESFYSQQLPGWATQLTKAIRALDVLAKKVHTQAPHRTRMTPASLQKQVQDLVHVPPLAELITYPIAEPEGH
jgi:transposase